MKRFFKRQFFQQKVANYQKLLPKSLFQINKKQVRTNMEIEVNPDLFNQTKSISSNENSKNLEKADNLLKEFLLKYENNFLYLEDHDRDFLEFLEKIETLMKSEGRRNNNINKYFRDTKKMPFCSREPLKEILQAYQIITNKISFDHKVLGETFLTLGKAYQSRDMNHREYNDYTHHEMINSFRFKDLVEDLKYGLTYQYSFLGAASLSKVINGLKLCGYKERDLLDLIFQKIHSLINKTPVNYEYKRPVDRPSFGKRNFYEKNYVADQLFYDPKFKNHMTKLMNTRIVQNDKEKSSVDSIKSITSGVGLEKEVAETEIILGDIGELIQEVRDAQYKITDTVNNLINQYYIIEQTLITNPDLLKNQYIKYEVYKLQDKLVQAGYIKYETIHNVTSKSLSNEEIKKLKFENVLDILRDFVALNYNYLFDEKFEKIASALEPELNYPLNENLFLIDATSLSECLANLSDYCKINNSDVNRDDYYNNVIEPQYIQSIDKIEIEKYGKIAHIEHNVLKTEYTIYFNETMNFFKSLENVVLEFINKEPKNLRAFSSFYYAYSTMPVQAKSIKDAILNNFELCLKEELQLTDLYSKKNAENVCNYLSKSLTNQEKFNFLYGLANSSYKPVNSSSIADFLANSIKLYEDINNTEFTLEEIIKVLWSMSYFKLYKCNNFMQILLKFHNRNTENYLISRVDNSLFNQLKLCLKYEAYKFITIPKFAEHSIDMNFDSISDINILIKDPYDNMTAIDPLKEGLIESIAKSLNGKKNNKELQKALTVFESQGLLNNIPYKPDLIFGFYGHKIALFTLGKDSANINDFHHNGYYEIVKRHLKENFNICAVFVPIHKAMNLDLIKLDITVNKDFNLEKHIAMSIKFDLQYNDLKGFSKFINLLVEKINDNIEEFDIHDSKENLEIYFNSLLEIVEKQNLIVYQYLPNLMKKYIDEIRISIIKHKLIYDIMSHQTKTKLNKLIRDISQSSADYNNFYDVILKKYDQLYIHTDEKITDDKNKFNNNESIIINNFWNGKRLNLDVTSKDIYHLKDKNLSIELMNNNFMWMVDYNPYSDWEIELRKFYDNFNYYINNDQQLKNRYLFNNNPLGNRNVPVGIIPNPDFIRKVKIPVNELNTDLSTLNQVSSSYEDELMNYKNMHQNLIKKEVFEKNKYLPNKPPVEISLKVNLLNIRNSLKKHLTDQQILEYIAKFNFIDQIASEHLNASRTRNKFIPPNEKELKKRGIFLKRDSKQYLDFHFRLNNIIDKYDEYDKFLMKEIHKENDLLEYDQGAENIIVDEEKGETLATKQVEEKVRTKMEETEDNDALSIIPANKWNFVSDIKSVLNAFKLAENDPDLEDTRLNSNPDLFLYEKRVRAERNIILSSIIFKLFYCEDKLTINEKKYISNLQNSLKSSNLLNFEKVGLNPNITKLKFSDLSKEDLDSLNSFQNTKFTEDYKDYSLSELILELSHFIDNNTIQKVILENFMQINFYQISEISRSTIFENYNKEPNLINQEIKESLWRLSGTLNEKDKEIILKFFRVKRGKSTFDRLWLDIDEKSLNSFIEDVNCNENRLLLLEKWLKRKEKEYATRINLPAKHLRHSDKTIHKILKKKENKELKSLLCKIFSVKETSMLKGNDITAFIENFCQRLYLFNFNYPTMMVDIFNALELCENLKMEDKELLNTYRTFFKVDENSDNYDIDEFLCVQPIQLEGETLLNSKNLEIEESLMKKMQKSHINYVTPLVNKMKQISLNL